mmetsp:Transcript_21593/g.42859  ORF Transcript_21593/g.42859 Transcript_21593/m.42859 type:complete len:101 (+) Transcript_21593:208-510(+)
MDRFKAGWVADIAGREMVQYQQREVALRINTVHEQLKASKIRLQTVESKAVSTICGRSPQTWREQKNERVRTLVQRTFELTADVDREWGRLEMSRQCRSC